MNGATFQQRPSCRRTAVAPDRHMADDLGKLSRESVGCDANESALLLGSNRALIRVAKPRSRFDQGLQYRVQIESRTTDRLEHVGGGGLLLQRFTKLVKQPRIFDGDDGLGGKGFHKRDLFIGKRFDLEAVNGDSAPQVLAL